VEVEANDATFKWQTASEQNNDGFYVQLSDDRYFGEFETLGFVAGQGTSNQEIAYQFKNLIYHHASTMLVYVKLILTVQRATPI
jgi:hypothetical protein